MIEQKLSWSLSLRTPLLRGQRKERDLAITVKFAIRKEERSKFFVSSFAVCRGLDPQSHGRWGAKVQPHVAEEELLFP